MIQSNRNKFLVGAGAAVGVAMIAVLVAAQLPAQAQVPAQDQPAVQAERPRPAVKIGTYDPETAFQAHPAHKKLMEAVRTAQTQMQQAQQEEDQQKMQQIQQQYEQAQQQAVQKFQQDVSEALPEAAKAAGVKVVATQVVYKADDVKAIDITPRLAKAFEEEEDDGEGREAPAVPQFPRH